MEILKAAKEDMEKILELQKKAFLQEARLYNNFGIQPLTQTLEEAEEEFKSKVVLKAVINDEIIGSVRANIENNTCRVWKLMVHPRFQGKGIGKALLIEIEKYFPEAGSFSLATGAKSASNIGLYLKSGYRIVKYDTFHDGVEAVFMEKTKYPENDHS